MPSGRFLIVAVTLFTVGCSDGGNPSTPPPEAAASLVLLAGVAGQGTGADQGGYVDATGEAARFNGANEVAVDKAGVVYVLDGGNRRIRKVSPSGVVTTLASFGDNALTFLGGMAIDDSANLFVTHWDQCPPPAQFCVQNAGIDRVDPSGNITPVAITSSSDGTGTDLGSPHAIARAPNGDLYLATRIVVNGLPIRPEVGAVRRLAANGDLTSVAGFNPIPNVMTVDAAGTLYVTINGIVAKMAPGGMQTEIGGPFTFETGIAVDAAGNVYVSDSSDQVVRKITPSGTVTVIAGMQGSAGFVGGALPGLLSGPSGLALHGRDLYIAMDTAIAVIRNVP